MNNSLLLSASYEGDKEKILDLLKSGVDIETKDEQKLTPLLLATFGKHDDTVSLLLANNANIEAKNLNGDTPLMVAACYGITNVLVTLLGHGANIESKNMYHYTPYACTTSDKSITGNIIDSELELYEKIKQNKFER